jgi:transposase
LSKQTEIEKLLEVLGSLTVKEIRQLRQRITKSIRISIPKADLKRLLEQNKSNRAIARFFKVSPRTISRRIKEYDLTGLRPKGRKPSPKAPRKLKIKAQWISMRRYFQKLDESYRFVNVKIPPKKWINAETLVASDIKGDPLGEFTTVGIYYVIQQSGVYLLYTTSIRFTENPVSFEAIYNWVYPRAYDIIIEHVPREAFVVEVVALTFEKTTEKPSKVEISQ